MSIKFRCHHCQQMLGIAQSRAGAVVDCPGCGRSLQVPLSQGGADSRSGATEEVGAAGPHNAANDRPDPLSPPMTLNDPEFLQALVSLAELDDDRREVPNSSSRPMDDDPPGSPLEIRARPDLIPTTQRWRWKEWLTGVVVGAILGTLAGWSLSRGLTIRDDNSAERLNGPAASDEPADARLPGDGRPIAGPSDDGTNGRNSAALPANAASVRGQITWMDAQQERQWDSHALVILLPVNNPGRLRLDGSSLREVQPDADQRAVAAALAEQQVRFVRADSEGRFELQQNSDQPAVLVVVSRHQVRAGDREISANVEAALAQFFQSSAAIVGRLSAVAIPIEEFRNDGQLLNITMSTDAE